MDNIGLIESSGLCVLGNPKKWGKSGAFWAECISEWFRQDAVYFDVKFILSFLQRMVMLGWPPTCFLTLSTALDEFGGITNRSVEQ